MAQIELIRPPWTLDAELLERCTRYGICREACRPGVIALDAAGLPIMDFARGGCDFCGNCAAACPEDLFDRDRTPWSVVAVIDGPCLSVPATGCGLCEAVCMAGAFGFLETSGGLRLATIDAELCTGCGACVPVCPTDAVTLRSGR